MELANPIVHGGEVWQGYFVLHNGVHAPMTLGIREDTRGNREGYLVSGAETHRENIWGEGDSVKMKKFYRTQWEVAAVINEIVDDYRVDKLSDE